jgi:hypothetical protein
MQERVDRRGEDPGVPEALPRTLRHLEGRVGAERIDRLWIFPSYRDGRTERGLVAASLFLDAEGRRRVVTAAWRAEQSGLELRVDPVLSEEGDAPPELLPRVMEGVVRRAGEGHGDPRVVEVEGNAATFAALLKELESENEEEGGPIP